MGQTKSAGLRSNIAFVSTEFGEAGLQRVLQQLGHEDRRIIETQGRLSSAWIPTRTWAVFAAAVFTTLAQGDTSLLVRMGEHSANTDLSGIYKIFVKLGSPEFILGRFARVLGTYFDHASAQLETPKAKSMVLTFRGFDQKDHLIEHCILGYCSAAIKSSGGKEVGLRITTSLAEGKDFFVIEGSWS